MPDSLLLPTTYADCTVSHLPRRESRFRLQLMAIAESSVRCCLPGGPTSTTSYSMRAILSVVSSPLAKDHIDFFTSKWPIISVSTSVYPLARTPTAQDNHYITDHFPEVLDTSHLSDSATAH
ncbi:hypothetical protein CPAR01_11681 [Colletotrichum paranaense]|uniref:Uncharacterized protein n=1 Tax=Colletotrichum paranaense TaxID=1914294 RepID=A0ABQ9S7T9_9PEZI|nr:uncharacterized protein CPAR01_11681 [Colletotrichum paranaense]KAK1529369.1 hypothetical protein CPAR01_11681 [Colletotrichum paranaense]